MMIRELREQDYYKGFMKLLEQLTTVDSDNITYDDFVRHLEKIKSKVFVMENDDGKIIGTIALLIEEKFIHKLSSVCHIEDVVVDDEYRGKGLGKILIDYGINYAKDNGCYKIILNCADKNIKFYEKCGFNHKNVEMSLYV
jgi:glucosamine-phosphate N-acetyltransferase